MQTFLPSDSFVESVRCLDNTRLGKQRVEAWQIFGALKLDKTGWTNHPAVLMWAGYEARLLEYGIMVCHEWLRRGFRDSMLERFEAQRNNYPAHTPKPWWLGNEKLHTSHRAALLYKGKCDGAWTKRNEIHIGLPDLKSQMKMWDWLELFRRLENNLIYIPNHYRELGWRDEMAIPDDDGSLPYFWPTKEEHQ